MIEGGIEELVVAGDDIEKEGMLELDTKDGRVRVGP